MIGPTYDLLFTSPFISLLFISYFIQTLTQDPISNSFVFSLSPKPQIRSSSLSPLIITVNHHRVSLLDHRQHHRHRLSLHRYLYSPSSHHAPPFLCSCRRFFLLLASIRLWPGIVEKESRCRGFMTSSLV
ncbi:hypothetical protein RND81_14G148600 [Saponaria officinalis]|uniref:Transmembrane protein n=1 Tax=Saponaria officinalis TaxID=3572 RepID=A0AAW1GPX0_SAPOF